MFLKMFPFSKIQKNPLIIENIINSFLEDGKSFKFASMTESNKNGKIHLSLYYEEKKSKIRVKVFKDSNIQNLEEKVNKFLAEGKAMKWSCQSSASNSIYLIVFYESGKTNDDKEKENKD